jgi:hypothetical protein
MYQDLNLGSRFESVAEVIDFTRFQDLCFAARDEGLQLVQKREEFANRVNKAEKSARELAERRLRRLRLRDGGEAKIKSAEFAFDERVVAAVSTPDVRLDSIGFFILKNRKPQASYVPTTDTP